MQENIHVCTMHEMGLEHFLLDTSRFTVHIHHVSWQ
jgi:hypothetical protein